MRITVQESVSSLADSLLEYDEIRRHGELVVHRDPIAAGELGGDGGWVDLVVSSGLDITAIVLAIAAWLRPRQPRRTEDSDPPTVLIEHDGVTVVMSDASPDTVEAVMKALRHSGANKQPPCD